MAVEVEIPEMGESITEAVLIEWLKEEGAYVEQDEPICVLETDKANVDLPSPAAGILRCLKEVDTTLGVGDVVARIESGGVKTEAPVEPQKEEAVPEKVEGVIPQEKGERESGRAGERELSPAVRRLVAEHGLDPTAIQGTGKGGRLTKEDVLAYLEERDQKKAAAAVAAPVQTAPPAAPVVAPRAAPAASKPAPPPRPAVRATAPGGEGEGVRREPMSRIRQRIAQHLVAAQQNAAMLTTFNEVDMSRVMALRAQYKERFAEVHGVSLGLMSFFSRAVVLALGEFPAVNAFIEGDEIVYHDYVNLGIAVSTERGLLVPVLRHAEEMSMARIESEIKRLAIGARDNKLNLDELSGGTFTITNGGVFGSLLSTPILNAPQSGILGMHAIQSRPVAVDGKVEIRPMMYVALSYDHRLIDGQTSVTFLVRIKQLVEDPARLLLQV